MEMSNMLITFKHREIDYQKRLAASDSMKENSKVYPSESY